MQVVIPVIFFYYFRKEEFEKELKEREVQRENELKNEIAPILQDIVSLRKSL